MLEWKPNDAYWQGNRISNVLQKKNNQCVRARLLQLCSPLVSPWTVAHQAPLSMELSRQEYWSGLPCPSPGDFPDPKTKPCSLRSPALQADSLPLSRQGSPITSSVAAILIFLHILQLYWFPYALNIVFLSHLLQ